MSINEKWWKNCIWTRAVLAQKKIILSENIWLSLVLQMKEANYNIPFSSYQQRIMPQVIKVGYMNHISPFPRCLRQSHMLKYSSSDHS